MFMRYRSRLWIYAFIALAIFCPLTDPAFAWCEYFQDQDPVCYPDPIYYVVLGSEPNWCDYATGDRLSIHGSVVNGQFVHDAWYVVPQSEPTSGWYDSPANGWLWDNYIINNSSGCYHIILP